MARLSKPSGTDSVDLDPAKGPISRDPATVARRILAAAEREFMTHGYEAASTNRIVAGFGGSKATLFRHFPTKQALLAAVVQRIAEGWEEAVDWRSIPDAPPQPWLVAFATRMLAWLLGDGPLFVGRLGIAEGHKFPGLAHVFHASAGAPLQQALARRLADWTHAQTLACADPAADAQRFFDLTFAGPVSRALYASERLAGAGLAAQVTGAVDLFLAARTRAD